MARVGAAGRIVHSRSIAARGVALLRDRLEGVWRWRELTAPPGLLYVAWAEGGGAATLAIAAVIGGAAAILLLARPALVLGVPGRCLARTRAYRHQRRWPRICTGLRWFRKIEPGALLVPELLAWRERGEQLAIELRPLPEQSMASWEAMADALRRYVGGATVEWRESSGTLRVVVGRDRLPDYLPWRRQDGDDGELVLGLRHGGRPLVVDARSTPHVLLSGATGSGKGGAIRATAAAALEGGWQLVVLDPKEAGEFAWLEALRVPVVTDLREQVDALELLAEVRSARQAVVRSSGVDTWLDARQSWRPVLVIVDEAADLLAATKGKGAEDRLRAALQHKAGELIAELARKGRSAGMHLLVAIQRPETAQLGDQGGALRNNLTARLALGSLDADGLRMLGVSPTDPVAFALDGTPGRGVCVGFACDPRPSACQVAWLDQERARAEVIPRYAQGLGEIQPASTELTARERMAS